MINISSGQLDEMVNASIDTFSMWAPVFGLVIVSLIFCVIVLVVKNILKR